jgi:hypothetical protein
LFQRSRHFYTCGHTALAVEAHLCGCEVVFCDDLPRLPLPDRETMNREEQEDLPVFVEQTQGEWAPFIPDNRGLNPGWETWVR